MVYWDRKMHIPSEWESRSNELDSKNNNEDCLDYLLILCHLNDRGMDSAWICIMGSFSVTFLNCSLSPILILYLMTNIKALLLAKEGRKIQPKNTPHTYSLSCLEVFVMMTVTTYQGLCVCA